jgi:oligopeptidase B
MTDHPNPPTADTRPFNVESPHGTRTDEYYWLRDDDRENADVLAYLEAENAYKVARLAHLKPLEEAIYNEVVDRIVKDDSSVPYRYRGYYYYRRYETDNEYPIYARKIHSLESAEEVLLNGNDLAADHEYFQLGDYEVSPNGTMLAWAEDTTGRRQFTIRFKNLKTGEVLADVLTGNDDELVWADDNCTLFYIENDPKTLQGIRLKRHKLGDAATEDTLVYELDDDSFSMGLGRTGDERYLLLHLASTVADEILFMAANRPTGKFRVLLPRARDHEYDADHIDDRWIIRTNWHAKNFRIMEADDEAVYDQNNWHERVAHDDEVYIGEIDVFRDFLVLAERRNGLRTLRVLNRNGETLFHVDADDPAYAMDIDINPEQDNHWLRYNYTSLTTPKTIYEINMATRERRLLKQEKVLGGFDPANYAAERLWACARDGTKIPVSLLHRKDFEKNGTAPLYQYAYGSYGFSEDPEFEDEILSLVDRGFVYAIAHVRGGQELGRYWYEQGKLTNKLNTFSDFIDVTAFLIEQGYAHPNKVVAAGGSAGGLLMGAIANQQPDLYAVIVADVPFVDVVTTMLDESIPLTTLEYDEWGNPNDKNIYDYMLTYSPYDNVKAQDYPAMLITTGLWDSQVQYYEPAKWVAKLRATKTDDNPLFLHINMEAGHGGQSGRFRRNRELAMEFAFILDQLNMNNERPLISKTGEPSGAASKSSPDPVKT